MYWLILYQANKRVCIQNVLFEKYCQGVKNGNERQTSASTYIGHPKVILTSTCTFNCYFQVFFVYSGTPSK